MVNIKEEEKKALAAFTKCFNNDKDIVDTQHENLTLSMYIETLPEYDAWKLEKLKLHSEETCKNFIGYTFIQGTDHIRTGKHKEDLSNQFDLGVNSYPCDLENATNMDMNDKNYVNNSDHPGKKINNKIKYPEK